MSPRDRRALILGAVVLGLGWLLLRGIPAGFSAVRGVEESVDRSGQELFQARRRVAEMPTLRDSVDAAVSVGDALPHVLLVGGDASTASLDLVRRIRAALAGPPTGGVRFDDGQRTQRSGPLSLAEVTVRLETDFQGLLEVTEALESDSALALETVDAAALSPHAPAAAERPEALAVELVVSGWFRHHAASTRAPPDSAGGRADEEEQQKQQEVDT